MVGVNKYFIFKFAVSTNVLLPDSLFKVHQTIPLACGNLHLFRGYLKEKFKYRYITRLQRVLTKKYPELTRKNADPTGKNPDITAKDYVLTR
jgi:hypothetical protein